MKVVRYCMIEDCREVRTGEQLFARNFTDDGFMLKGFNASAPFLRFMPPLENAERLAKGQSNFTLFEDVMELLTDESSFLDEVEMLDLMGGIRFSACAARSGAQPASS